MKVERADPHVREVHRSVSPCKLKAILCPHLTSDREENTIKEERLIYLSVQSTAKVMTPLGRRARDVMRLICAARFPRGLDVVHFIRLVKVEGR